MGSLMFWDGCGFLWHGVWKYIGSESDLFSNFIMCDVRHGSRIHFLGWSMVWTHAFKVSYLVLLHIVVELHWWLIIWIFFLSTLLGHLMLFMDILYLGVADRLIWVASSLKEFNVRCTIANLRKLEKDLFFSPQQTIWQVKSPWRVVVFLYIVALGNITFDNK